MIQLLQTMKTRTIYLFLVLYSISVTSFSQTSESSVPTPESKDSVLNIFNTWNGTGNVEPVKSGIEISGFFFNRDYPWIETYGVSLALYTGQSYSFNKMIRSFAEYSPLYHTYNEKPQDYKYSNTFLYFAPGISLYSLNRKYSLDLYKRLETPIYNYGKQFIVPLKLNLHF
jgi:hypothetical protein